MPGQGVWEFLFRGAIWLQKQQQPSGPSQLQPKPAIARVTNRASNTYSVVAGAMPVDKHGTKNSQKLEISPKLELRIASETDGSFCRTQSIGQRIGSDL